MIKKIFKIIFILLIVVIIGLGAHKMYIRSITGKSYKYDEGNETLTNPYIGYAPSCTSTSLCENTSLVYLEIHWSDLEPKEGVYDWETIETNAYLERWRDEGKKLVLRFVCDTPKTSEHMDIPQWLYDKTGDGVFYDISYGKGYCPDYNNTVFIKEHEKVIKEIADHFRNDDFLVYVELGSLGHWGEWHTYYTGGLPRMPKTAVRTMYVSHYVKYFDYCKLLMRRPFAELPEGAGVFNDMTGISHDTSIWLSWIEEGGDFNASGEKNALKAVPEIWKTAPVGGEFASSVPISTMLGSDYDQTISLLEKSHMSFIGPMVPYMKREDKDFYDAAKRALRYVGYRYRIKSLLIKNPIGQKYSNVTITMINDGVAPIYFDSVPCLYITLPEETDENIAFNNDGYAKAGTDAEGMVKIKLDIDLKELAQGEETECTIQIPRYLFHKSGMKLYAGIENPKTEELEILLDMDAERKGSLSLIWAKY
ncbi:DUF4832 domain-containing protein [Butyrivibrio sp. YAB3001]|uniref:DUF4832 domain-containing protein n=1 Tax=Butyrivibrio sp. YAB3001 TaxID=1520812 RepID=UPI0008F61E7F|nr:DUF4832 domain-containing protein [Butyrivibrio sp. YAB3001]SFC09879.1 Beta-galactosidase [Butyrivibrio sp. YAB3001]